LGDFVGLAEYAGRTFTAGIPAVIDILIIAVHVGGLRRPIGPFVGAFIYVLFEHFQPRCAVKLWSFNGTLQAACRAWLPCCGLLFPPTAPWAFGIVGARGSARTWTR
jgi:ABC-type branched-subunit amino acid transport system permease subunit